MATRRRPRPARTRSISTTLASLLVLPVVALVGLWALLASITLGNALTEHNDNRLANSFASATDRMLAALEQERSQTFFWLSSPLHPPVTELTASRRADDAAIAAYEGGYPHSLSSRSAVLAELGKVAVIREAVNARMITASAAFEDYSEIVDGLFAAYISTRESDVTLYRHVLGAIDAGRAVEQFTRELTLAAAASFNRGQLPAPDLALFASAVSDQRLLVEDALTEAQPELHASLARLYDSPLHSRVATLEDQIAAGPGSRAQAALRAFGPAATSFLGQFKVIANDAAKPIGTEAGQESRSLFTEAALAGGLGLVAVAGVIVLMLRFGRRIRRELTDLHDGAEAMARERLPAIVERLGDGQNVDVDTASPPLPAGRITEVARVADAFSSVQHTAVDAAVGQANLRNGLRRVFLNLSLRNQSILHRQLGMLDALERATDDPAALADLFRLDHLTTRMRRHAESLIILSGAAPGRSWREPVRLLDVLRAAVAEVEDYTRVEVVCDSAAAVIGPAANDVVHLIAELVENGTSFSPPNTKVEISVDTVGTGVAVEVEDRGLGMTSADLARTNAILASPPGFDLAGGEHLGMFVVGQLAARHGIGVSLRRSHYGGVTAVVLLPNSIVVLQGQARLPEPARLGSRLGEVQGSGSVPAVVLTGRYALDPGKPADRGGLPRTGVATADPGPRGPFEPLRHQDPDSGQAREDETYRGLPRRVRQASLAPQLRGRNVQPPAGAATPHDLAGPSPEQTLRTMSSLQDGWRRGRLDQASWPDDASGRQRNWPDPANGGPA